MRRIFLLAAFLYAIAAASAQTGNTTIQPDCLITFTLAAAGNFPATTVAGGPGDNRTKGCAAWTLMYQNTGMTSVTVTLQSASTTGTTPSFGSFAGTISTGYVNPIVSDTGGSVQATNGTADISWVRVNVAATGAGTLTGVLYGFRNSSAAVNAAPLFTGCPAGTLGAIQFYLTSTTCGGNVTAGAEYTTTHAAPGAAPAVVATCTGTCVTGYLYSYVPFFPIGPGVASATSVNVNNAATLDMTHSNAVTVPAVIGASAIYVYSNAGGAYASFTWLPIGSTGAGGGVVTDTGAALIDGCCRVGTNADDFSVGIKSPIGRFGRVIIDPAGALPYALSLDELDAFFLSSSSSNVDIGTYSTADQTSAGFGISSFVGIIYNDVNHTSSSTGEMDIIGAYPTGGPVTFTDIKFFDGVNAVTLLDLMDTTAVFSGTVKPGTGGYLSVDGTTGTTGNGFKNGLCVTASGACVGGAPVPAGTTTADEQCWASASTFGVCVNTTISGRATEGSATLTADVVNPFIQAKNTQTATAPGAAKCDLRWIAGTNATTGKIVAACGTSATEVTIADNVGNAF